MKWLVLLVGVLCSVGVKATDVSNETELRAAIERGDSYIRLSDNINQINLTKTLTVTSGERTLDLNTKKIYFDYTNTQEAAIAIVVNGGDILVKNGTIEVLAAKGKKGTLVHYNGYPGSNAVCIQRKSGKVALMNNVTLIAKPGEGGEPLSSLSKKGIVGEAYTIDPDTESVGDMLPGAYIEGASADVYTNTNGYPGTSTSSYTTIVKLTNYTALFNVDGSSYSTSSYTIAGNFSFPTYNKKGYKLSDWSPSPADIKYVNAIPVIATNHDETAIITFNATTSIIQYLINCDLNGGTITSGKQPDPTYTVESPDITLPTLYKDHYNFKGWRYDLSETERVENSVTIKQGTSTGNRSFTAQFTPIDYPITYERYGGENESGNPETYNVETQLELERPIRSYYDFEGWYTDADFTKPFLKFEKQYYGNPLKLYAKWSPTEYNVALYNGDTKYEKWGELYRTVEKGLDLSLYQPIRDGYIFMGWSTDKEGKNMLSSVPTGHESVVLYAQWKIISFVINYHTDGGTELPDDQYSKETKDDTQWKTGVHVKKNGYVFRGWFLTPDFSGNPLTGFPLDGNLGTPSDDKSVVTIHLYARWEVQDYSIVFQNAGDNFIDNRQYNIEQGILEKDMPQPTWVGRKFLGWFNESGEQMKSVSPGTGSLTLSAKWELVKYKIEYDTNGGHVSDEQLEYTILDHVKLVTPTKEHYTFTGWYTEKEGGEKYMHDEFYSQTGDKVVYAHWAPKTYHLSFKTNGGSAIEGSFPFTYGETIDIDKRTYRFAYTFDGWYRDEAFTQPFNKETDGKIGGDLVVYAKWIPTRYKIKYDMFHGENIPEDSYSIEEEKVLPENAIRDGFSFAGWYADMMLTDGPVKKIEKGSSGEKTFYATWKRGNFIHFLTPENGTIKVVRRGKELVSGDMVGTDVELEISAIPVSEKYRLKSLSIGGKTYTASPQTIKMPASDLYISAIFEDARTAASAPEIITDPENTDNMLTGTVVKVTLKKTDENTTLYYSISDGPKRLYEGPFEVSTDAKQLITLKAFAVKEGYKDGVTVRDMGFGVKKLLVTFDLPAGITAVNPLGGEVISAIASGGAFEFSLEVDRNYFQSLDSMTVLANDSVLTANANGIYRVEGASKDVKITVKGLESVTYTVTLAQATKGGHIHFTEDGSDGSLTLPFSKRISVTAVPDLNYKFGGWKNGSQANPGIFTITSDTTLEAVFVPDAKYFTITLPVLEGVEVKPLSKYSTEVLHGEKFHFYLRFADGYHGEGLAVKANGVELAANEEGVYSLYRIARNYSISVEGVVKDGVKLKLAEHVSAVDIATATDAMKARLYPESMISLLATAPEGKYFVKWNDGNSDNPRVVTVREASGTLPLFQPIPEESGKKDYAKIRLPNVVGAGVGVQVDVHTIEVGGKMPFKVVLLPGYSQSEVKVTANGKTLEEGLSMRAASKSRTLVYSLANVEKEVKIEISGLKLDTYNVGVEQSEGGKASVSPSGRVECGKQVVFTATPDAGNMFVKWSDGNTLNPYPLSLDGDTNLKAVFMRSDMAVANEEIAPSVARIYVRAGKLYVETEASDLYIWNMEGVLIKRSPVPGGCSVHLLPAGFYLVKVGDGQPVKIAIR